MASLAWRAETVHGQIGPGTEFGILPEAWILGEAPKFPPVKTPLTVHFPNGAAARVDLVEVSDDDAIIQTSHGAKWRMSRTVRRHRMTFERRMARTTSPWSILRQRLLAPISADITIRTGTSNR
jgi:hypothetical protein